MEFKFWKSVKNDYTLAGAFSGIVLGIAFLLYFSVVSKNNNFIEVGKMIELGFCPKTYVSFTLATILLLVIIGSLICMICRVKFIKSFMDVKTTVKAKVLKFRPVKNAFRVVVEIPVKDETFRKKMYVMLSADTRELKKDTELELLIKDDDPKKTLLADLFFE